MRTATKRMIPKKRLLVTMGVAAATCLLTLSSTPLGLGVGVGVGVGVVDAFASNSNPNSNANPNAKMERASATATTRTMRATTLRRNLFELRQLRDDNNQKPKSKSKSKSQTNVPSNSKKKKKTNTDPWLNLMVAATFVVTATLGGSSPSSVARAAPPSATAGGLDLVSPGTATVQAKIRNGDREALRQSTETAFASLIQTALLDGDNRSALTDSVQRLRASVQSELTSVEAWGKVIKVLDDYGVDLQQETDVVVRPPADWKRVVDDVVEKQQVNVLINGEILQITTEYHPGSNEHLLLDDSSGNGNSNGIADANAVVEPDDEWILRIRGYKGFDPTALTLALEPSRYDSNTPQWFRDWNSYWHAPLTTGLARTVLGPERTHGDAIVLEGAAALGLSYAISYAYYATELEKAEEEANQKREKLAEAAKKKKAAAAAAAAVKELEEDSTANNNKKKEEEKKEAPKPKPEPVVTETVSTVETNSTSLAMVEPKTNATATAVAATNATNVTVTIDFDKQGKVVLTAERTSKDAAIRPDGLLAFLQALYFPWMGFFFPSTAGTYRRPKIVALFQALYFPWAGVFFPRTGNNCNTNSNTNTSSTTAALPDAVSIRGGDGDASSSSKNDNNHGVLPFVRALWFPWIGILQGK
eukprot:jgi/Psemu1/15679/gm1.15679_g